METREDIKRNLEKVVARGQEVERMVRCEGYKIIKKGHEKEIDSLKYAYSCNSLKELEGLKKYRKGLLFIKNEIKRIINAGTEAKILLARYYKD